MWKDFELYYLKDETKDRPCLGLLNNATSYAFDHGNGSNDVKYMCIGDTHYFRRVALEV